LIKHKPWFHEGCSELLDQKEQDKLQWLQNQSEINGDNLNNVRYEASRHFRNKKREYLKDKMSLQWRVRTRTRTGTGTGTGTGTETCIKK
jgi:hypothetical protein